jgi:toxin-antitoxin system PIN domain toxin
VFVVDTNVLVYAADRSAEAHVRCRQLLEEWRSGSTPWYLTWNIIYEFLRVVTHPRVFRKPWSISEAWGFIRSLLESPGLFVLGNGEAHPEQLAAIIGEVPDLRGNLLHDAHTAALMREHGIRAIYTRDSDFHRFPYIEVRDPLR